MTETELFHRYKRTRRRAVQHTGSIHPAVDSQPMELQILLFDLAVVGEIAIDTKTWDMRHEELRHQLAIVDELIELERTAVTERKR